MIQTKQIGKFTEISVTEGYLHKIGSDVYVKRCILVPPLTIDDYEEVAEIPPYTKDEYDKKVAELVRERYSADEEFAIQRKMINANASPETLHNNAISEYQAYNAYVEECKERAKDAELYKTLEDNSSI